MRKFPSNILLYFSIFTGGSGGKKSNQTTFRNPDWDHYHIPSGPSTYCKAESALGIWGLTTANRIHAKNKGGTESGRMAKHLGSAGSLILCVKCTEVSSWDMYLHPPEPQKPPSPMQAHNCRAPATGRNWLLPIPSAASSSTTTTQLL